MAEKGVSLMNIAKECRIVKTKVATNGAAVTACTLPGQKEALFKIEVDEIELGLGIHGEAGTLRTKVAYIPMYLSVCEQSAIFLNEFPPYNNS